MASSRLSAYAVVFSLDAADTIFSLEVEETTDTFVLHTNELNIGDVSIRSSGLDTEQTSVSRSFDAEKERGSFVFPTKFPAATKVQLKLAFEAPLKSSMLGYYVSKGKDGGKSKRYTLTQFEVRIAMPLPTISLNSA